MAELSQNISIFNRPVRSAASEGTPETVKIGDLFKIGADYAKMIQSGDYKSYTFRMVPRNGKTNPNQVVNMLFARDSLGNMVEKAVLVYHLTDAQMVEMDKGQPITGHIDYVYFDPDTDFRTTSSIDGEDPCSDDSNCPEGEHSEYGFSYIIHNEDGTYEEGNHCICVEDEVDPSLSDDGHGSGSPDGDQGGNNGPNGPIVITVPTSGIPGGPNGGGPIGGGMGSGGSGYPDGSNNDTIPDTYPYPDDCLHSGGCDVTTPVLNEHKDPCQNVRDQFKDEAFRGKLNALKTYTDETNEWGFSETSDGGLSAISEGDETSWKFEITSTTIGAAHTHPFFDTLMFSTADFIKFTQVLRKMAYNENAHDEYRAYAIMMCDMGGTMVNYILKFTGSYADIYNHFNGQSLSSKELKAAYRNYYRIYKGDLEKAFINLVNDKILDGDHTFKDAGFHLMKFELNDDGSLKKLSEVSLNENGEPQDVDCEQ